MSTLPDFFDGLALPAPLRAALGGSMRTGPAVKICGLSTPGTLEAALSAGAELVGFVFFPKSPRNLTLEAVPPLAAQASNRAVKVALSVNAGDDLLDAIVDQMQPDMLQFHGTESPERVLAAKARYGLPIMKALGISGAEDLAAIPAFDGVADRLLFDAKPPKGADLPGGNGLAFDWDLLAGLTLKSPFMLSGGLDASNVAEAASRTRAGAVDVSSGVESAPGLKDPAQIEAFITALRGHQRMEPLGSTRATR